MALFCIGACSPANSPSADVVALNDEARTALPLIADDTVNLDNEPHAELDFVDIAPGIEFFQGRILIGGVDVEAYLVRADDSLSLDVVASVDARASGNSLSYFAREYGAQVALSGGFLRSFTPVIPLGMVIVDGETVSAGVGDAFLDGIVLANDEEVAIGYSGRIELQDAEDGLQSGPVLIAEGEAIVRRNLEDNFSSSEVANIEGLYGRAFLALDGENRRIMGVTGPVSLRDLTKVLIRPTSEGGVGAVSALNLSGALSRGLVIDVQGFNDTYFNTDIRIATALLIRERANAHQ